MKWYQSDGRDKDIVLSTRVRLARNFKDYPFEPRLNEAGAVEIVRRVTEIFRDRDGWKIVDFSALTPAERMAYAEEHFVSREFAEKKGPSALIVNEGEGVSIMVLEEDHLRIQCILPGLDAEEAYRRAAEADALIDGVMRYAYSEQLGYLTHCPTNLGTGMRASVMMFLPAWVKGGGLGGLQSRLEKMGFAVRGTWGENSEVSGCLCQISNRVTLGITEEETLRGLKDAAAAVGEKERSLRERMTAAERDDLANTAMRAIGMSVYSLRLTSAELLKLYSDIRLGAAMGLTGQVTPVMTDELLFSTMPNTLAAGENGAKTAKERDKRRADRAKEIFAQDRVD